jgi:hypothetical protein
MEKGGYGWLETGFGIGAGVLERLEILEFNIYSHGL